MLRAAIILLVLILTPAAQAEKRIALLIGNKEYKRGVGTLVNPLNDIRLVGQALRTVGFETLKPVENGRRSDMLLAVHAFAARLKAAGPDAVGFLYYSGHGIASAGENYLIPVDVDEPSTVLLSVQGVKHSEVLTILRTEAPNAAHYLVLDACRNTLQGARGGKGFVPIGQQSGVLVAFATEPGKTASDTGTGSGPYAAALAAELVKPGQIDLVMFHNVRVAVIQRTGGDQVPWTEDGIQRPQRVLFAGEGRQPQIGEAERTWPWIKDTTNAAVLESFIRQFGDTPQGALARARLEEVRRQAQPTAYAPATPDQIRDFAQTAGDTVYFYFDGNLTPDADERLSHQAKWLQAHPKLSVTIEGHADERSSRSAAIASAAKRAEAVRDILVRNGVDAARIKTVSHGNLRPAATCNDESCWALNRRVKTVLDGGGN